MDFEGIVFEGIDFEWIFKGMNLACKYYGYGSLGKFNGVFAGMERAGAF